MRTFFTLFFLFFLVFSAQSQATNDILNLLIENNTITQEQADSIRAEAAIKQQESDAKKKSFPITSGKEAGYINLSNEKIKKELDKL